MNTQDQSMSWVKLHPAAVLVYLSLLASQLVPTFGTQLGFAGNYLPISMAVALAVPAALYFLLALSFSMRSGQYYYIFLLAVLLPTTTLLGHFFTGPTFQTFIDIAKPLLFVFFFILGLVFCRVTKYSGGNYVFSIIAFSFLINALLFVIFLQNADSGFLNYYRTRVIGGLAVGNARFSGAWNFPYNLTVFLVAFYTMALAMLFSAYGSLLKRVLALTLACLTVVMIALAQSRTAIVAVFLAPFCLLFIVHGVNRNLTRKRIKISTFARNLAIIAFCFLGFFLWSEQIYNVFQVYVARIYERAALGGVESLLQSQRFERFDRVFDGINDAPIGLLFGFSRESVAFSGDPFESAADYFVRFGFVGGSVFFFISLVYALKTAVFGVKYFKGVDFLICVFLAALSISVVLHFTTTIFYHFRFIPIFAFIIGYVSEMRVNLGNRGMAP